MSNLIRCQNGHMFSSRRYGTVCPYCNIETATREKKEIGQTDTEIEEALFMKEENPVCGWVVCVAGPRRGKDYRVMAGKNLSAGRMTWTFRYWETTRSHGEITV